MIDSAMNDMNLETNDNRVKSISSLEKLAKKNTATNTTE